MTCQAIPELCPRIEQKHEYIDYYNILNPKNSIKPKY